MRDKIRNFFLLCFYFTGLPCWRVLLFRLRKVPLLRVACFHEIKNQQAKDFEKKLDLMKRKFNVISAQDFLDKNLCRRKTNLLLTFDDGFENWFQNVVPALQKRGMPAVFFLDKRGLGFASKLCQMGFEIGGHTLHHQRLTELSPFDLGKKLRESKQQLEKKLGKEIIFFAYPFGDIRSFDAQVKEEVKKAEFKYVFTLLPGFNHSQTDPYLLHRDGLNPSWGNWLFLAWLRGSYDWLKRISDFFLKRV